MYKIKMIGPKYIITPLAVLGIETFPADDEVEAKNALTTAAAPKEPALIFITERLAADLQAEIAKKNQKAGINIALIPDNQGSIGLAAEQISRLLKNSIGAEVVVRQ